MAGNVSLELSFPRISARAFASEFISETCQTISCQWSFSIPPEEIRKPEVFCFQGVKKKTSGMK